MAQTLSEAADTHWSAQGRTIRPKVVDNFFEKYPTVAKFRTSAMRMVDTGGRGIEVHVRTSGGTAGTFSEYDVLDKSPINPVESAFYNKRYYYHPIILSDTESWENAGPEKRFDEMAELREVAMEGILKAINEDIYGAQSGKSILGFQDHIADAAGATVGGINSSTTTAWENQRSTSSATFLTQSSTNVFDGIDRWNDVLDLCRIAKGRPRNLFTTWSIVKSYRIALSSQGYARTTVENAGGIGGPQNPPFYDMDVIADNDCTALHSYFHDPDAIKMAIMSKVNFRKTPFVTLQSNGQLAQLAYMVAGVQLQNVARRSNGVATAITGT
tara:strand:+ start:7188 stop:8171 length:984 start_codon:yes stop_codon:yes gene_type:complete